MVMIHINCQFGFASKLSIGPKSRQNLDSIVGLVF